jgi:lysine 2,3-aminomutase
VLLRGVNDDAETLGALMRAFVECRIKPYYLHHADLAPGTAHLRTGIAHGQHLMRQLHGRFSGLCQPAYVLDIPGGYGKSPIGPHYLAAQPGAPARYMIEDYNGRQHAYPPAWDAVSDSAPQATPSSAAPPSTPRDAAHAQECGDGRRD